ncbi:MAG: glutathione S-transferase [Rhodospirillales bacterium]|jgi:glutathione S-transferase|nr:glutathione S-transferase [Rhodospirillales bacterium]
MLRLLGRATSGNVQKILFLLEELGTRYEREDYGRIFNNTGTPEYLGLNPTNKVPTLIDGDLVIWESHTILRYVAAREKSGLYPADPAARTYVERWMDWTLAALNPVYLVGFREAKKDAAERKAAVGQEIAAELKILEGQLAKNAWVAGGDFSVADIALAPIAIRCIAFPLDLPKLPAIEAWLDRLRERPAFVKATAAN